MSIQPKDNPLFFKHISTVRQPGSVRVQCNSLAISHKYGVVALSIAGQLHLVHIDHILSGGIGETKEIGDIFKTNVPSHILASTEELLAVGVQDTVFLLAYPELLKDAPHPFTTIKVKTQVVQIAFNPTDGTMIAILSSDGNLRLNKIGMQSIQAFAFNDTQITCICFSPKGKQICVGHKNGEFSQLKLDLTVAKKFAGPGAIPISLLWVSTTQFIALFREGEDICLAQIDLPKGSPPVVVSLGDVFISDVVNEQSQCYFSYLNMDTIICSSTTSSEIVALTKSPNSPVWVVVDIEDSRRAALPIDNYSTGGVIYYNHGDQVSFNESEVYGHMPVYLVASQWGVLSAFSVVNKDGLGEGAKLTCSQQLNWPSMVIQQQKAPVQIQVQLPTPPPPVAFTTAAPFFPTQPIQVPIPISGPVLSSFAPIQIQSQPIVQVTQVQPPQPQVKIQEQKYFVPVDATSGRAHHGTPTTFSEDIKTEQQQGQPESSVTLSQSEVHRDPITTRLRKQSRGATTLPTDADIEKLKSQIQPTDACSESLLRQFEDLQIRLSNFRQLKMSFNKGFDDGLSALANNVEIETSKLNKMEDFNRRMENTCKVQRSEVNLLKDKTLMHISQLYYARSLEERNRDPKYLQLLRSQPMDPTTLKKLREIENLAGYIRTQIQECRRHNYYSKCPPLSVVETAQYIQKTLAAHSIVIKRLAREQEKLMELFTPKSGKELDELTAGLMKTSLQDTDNNLKKETYEKLRDFARNKTIIKLKSGNSSGLPAYYYTNSEDKHVAGSNFQLPVTSAELLKEFRECEKITEGDSNYSPQSPDPLINNDNTYVVKESSPGSSGLISPTTDLATTTDTISKFRQQQLTPEKMKDLSAKFPPFSNTDTITFGHSTNSTNYQLSTTGVKLEMSTGKPAISGADKTPTEEKNQPLKTQPFEVENFTDLRPITHSEPAFGGLPFGKPTQLFQPQTTRAIGLLPAEPVSSISQAVPRTEQAFISLANLVYSGPQNVSTTKQTSPAGEVAIATSTATKITAMQQSDPIKSVVPVSTGVDIKPLLLPSSAETLVTEMKKMEAPVFALATDGRVTDVTTPVGDQPLSKPEPPPVSVFTSPFGETTIKPIFRQQNNLTEFGHNLNEPANPTIVSVLPNTEENWDSEVQLPGSLNVKAESTAAAVTGITAVPISIPAATQATSIFAQTQSNMPSAFSQVTSSTTSSLFGQPQTAPASMFGQPTPPPTNSLFGQPSSIGRSMFAEPAPSTGANSSFAQQSTTPEQTSTETSSSFAQQSTQPTQTLTASNSIFGQQGTPAVQTSTTSSSIFGLQNASTVQSPGQTSIFGQSPSPAANTSIFGQPVTPATPSMFGQSATPTASSIFSQSTASAFGQPVAVTPSVFGQPQAASPSSIFGGSSASTVSSPTVFGQSGSTSIFGQPSQSVFGQSPITPSPTVFGQTGTATSPKSVFGQPASSPSVFGQSAPSVFGQQSAFGQVSSSTTQSPFGSSFGGAGGTSSFGSKPVGSIFGATTIFGGGVTTGTSGSFNALGTSSVQSSAAPESLFGSSAFSGLGSSPGLTGSTGGNIFGGGTAFGQSSSTASSIFGQPSTSLFRAPTQQSAFGSTIGTSPVPSAFGTLNTNPTTVTPVFGGAPVFGSPAFGTSSFGGTGSTAFAPSSGSSIFGGAAVQQGTIGFGQLAQQGGVGGVTPFQSSFGFGSQQQQQQQQHTQPTSFGGSSFSSWR